MRPSLLLACLTLSLPLSAGVLQDISQHAEHPAPEATATQTPYYTPTPAPTPCWNEPCPTPTATPDWGLGTIITGVAIVAASPYWLPAHFAKDDQETHGSYPPSGGPAKTYEVQALSGAAWSPAVRDGNAMLRLAWLRLELESDWLQMQEPLDDGHIDRLNQYQAYVLYRWINTRRVQGRSGIGIGLLSPLNQSGVLHSGFQWTYQLEGRPGPWVIRLREDLGGLGPLFYSNSRLSLGYQWGPLELFGGLGYRDYSGIGFGGPFAGALGTF